ncbi:MAG TPA: hypothetical protein VFY17_02350, partial [Pilimelia sp.]|nr:hypothetical protein [Pilimelia sp.]
MMSSPRAAAAAPFVAAALALGAPGPAAAAPVVSAAAPAPRSFASAPHAGAAAVVASGADTGAAAPAAAGTVDLAVTVTGTTLAGGAATKVADVTVVNHSGRTATGVTVAFDLGRLDQRRVALRVPQPAACRDSGQYRYCRVADVRAGGALDLAVTLRRLAGAGPAGRLRVGVFHDGIDLRRRNNVVVVPVRVGGHGPDLYTYVPDAPFALRDAVTGSAAPGRQFDLHYVVGNAGSQRVAGFIVRIALPPGAIFARRYRACTYDGAMRTAFCMHPNRALVPEGAPGRTPTRLRFRDAVTVAGAAGARQLVGGRVSVTPLAAPRAATAGAPARRLPDVDPGDNVD